ncbi:hypothetical protein DPMN_020819 [Dreissena polymorpha]|uniref:Uncharacterized protein n=1 Tax=Dreissena polymorpha TaxID=45954 RepID=A0A9D4S9E4_DREPO|nr:hypothetical protein DPMN_020819 [Dreissena polymorpha]
MCGPHTPHQPHTRTALSSSNNSGMCGPHTPHRYVKLKLLRNVWTPHPAPPPHPAPLCQAQISQECVDPTPRTALSSSNNSGMCGSHTSHRFVKLK